MHRPAGRQLDDQSECAGAGRGRAQVRQYRRWSGAHLRDYERGRGLLLGTQHRGQLGDGTTTTSAVPVAVTGSLTFQLIAAGGFSIGHTCALTDLAAAYCWGDNERGQLGIGSGGFGSEDLTPHPVPTLVSGGITFAGLTAGLGRHSCGLADLGAAYCWAKTPSAHWGTGPRRTARFRLRSLAISASTS